MNKISAFFNDVKNYIKSGLNWLKTNGDYKVIGIGFIIGLLTFSTWASFFLALLTYGAFYFFKTKAATYLNMINFNFDKYVINAVIGLICASIIIFII